MLDTKKKKKNQITGFCETSKVVKICVHFGYLGTLLYFSWVGGGGGLNFIGFFCSFRNTGSGTMSGGLGLMLLELCFIRNELM